jgi:hypothetical protein
MHDANLAFSGLVDYVSEKGTTAIDRALSLAEEIAANGAFILSRMTVMMFNLASPSTYCLTFCKAGYFTSSGTLSRVW